MLNFKNYFIFLVFVNFLYSNENLKETEYIIIFIHGSHELKHLLRQLIKNPFKIRQNIREINSENYENYILSECRHRRWNKSMFDLSNIPYIFGIKQGIEEYIEDDINRKFSNFTKHTIKILIDEFKKNFLEKKSESNIIRFFIYSWDGLLCEKNRIKNAKGLKEFILKIKESNSNNKAKKTKFIFVAFSHGGNLCLDIAEHITENENLKIDWLILLGTPIYERSEINANKKISDKYLFKRIINLYSEEDLFQVSDVISCISKEWFPKRLFYSRKENLYQFSFLFTKQYLGAKNKIELNNGKNMLEKLINKKNKFFFAPDHRKFVYFNNETPPVILFFPAIMKKTLELSKNSYCSENKLKIVYTKYSDKIYFFEEDNKNLLLQGFYNLNNFYNNYLNSLNIIFPKKPLRLRK